MMIKEFAEKYQVERRTIDYWTNLGLLHPLVLDNGYRVYGEEAEQEMENILVASMMDGPGSIESKYQKLLDIRSQEDWAKIRDSIRRGGDRYLRHYGVALATADRRCRNED